MRRAAWQSTLTCPAWPARPNGGHPALVTLEQRGKLDALITQNVDELPRGPIGQALPAICGA